VAQASTTPSSLAAADTSTQGATSMSTNMKVVVAFGTIGRHLPPQYKIPVH
jgi:hypothetical protein